MALSLTTIIDDVRLCLSFYTRLPVSLNKSENRSFSEAQWAAPFAGLIVGLICGVVLWLGIKIGLPPMFAAALALGASMLTTGALHEDGLADVADGFGGGHNKERKLEIMRDSRLGTYGALALIVAFALKISALTALTNVSLAFTVYLIVAAHTASRALLPAFMAYVPPARHDGLSASIASSSHVTLLASVTIGLLILIAGGLLFTGTTIIALALLFLLWKSWTMKHINGQTGDVLGALQQSAEIIILMIATVIFL